jgi:hypothetical protein
MPIFQFVATLAATLFSGAAIYINLVEHPARLECGTELAATVFGPSYRRAAVMQALLAIVATIGGIGAWFMNAGLPWLAGALLIFLVVPFTDCNQADEQPTSGSNACSNIRVSAPAAPTMGHPSRGSERAQFGGLGHFSAVIVLSFSRTVEHTPVR